mgnify:CR=1 FL=1
MISKKKFGTTVTAFGVAAGMLLGSAAPAHAEETAKTVQETQKDQRMHRPRKVKRKTETQKKPLFRL